MSLRHSLRQILRLSAPSKPNSRKSRKSAPIRFEQLETRALLTSLAGDFNGDGYDDVVVGSPGDSAGGMANSGSVQVIYGSPSGLMSNNNRRIALNSSGMKGTFTGGERFGSALAVGDFNGDGYDDVAIGAPQEMVDGVASGAVHILFGSKSGLVVKGNQVYHFNTPGINGVARSGDLFGRSLAVGDFNGDHRDDLAIGSPGKRVGGYNNAGAVNIIYGRSGGLSAKGDQRWTQDSPGVKGNARTGDQFGFSLATGDLNADGRDDLAIGIIGEKINDKANAGAVYIMYGQSSTGLSTKSAQYRHTDQEGVLGDAIENGQFGYALAMGDFNDDSRYDLAIGAPGERATNTAIAAGAVHVFTSGRNGSMITGNQKWDQGVAAIGGVPSATNRFGSSLNAGRINRDRYADLVIGIPGDTVSSQAGAGAMRVLFGAAAGLSTTGTASVFMTQASNNMLGTVQADDRFGSSIAIGDFNNDRLRDVAVGVPGDQNEDDIKAGSINVFYARANPGASGTLTSTGAQRWEPGFNDIRSTPHNGDLFGGAII